MKKIIFILSSLALVLLLFCAVYFSGALFDLAGKNRINSFVFQPNNFSSDRIGRPIGLDELSDKYVSERLIEKFMNEYFYVIPSQQNVVRRKKSDAVMKAMAESVVYNNWIKTVVPDLESLANNRMLRRVHVIGPILKPDEYYIVNYQLETSRPNDFDAIPQTTSGTMYLKIRFEKGIRQERAGQPFDAGKYLESGGDPAAVFKFRIEEIK